MIRICKKLTESFVRVGILDPKLKDWCFYWLQKRMITSFGILLMFSFGSLIYGILPTCAFLFGLLPLRRRVFGFHTKSPHTCMILSLTITLISLQINSMFSFLTALIFSFVNFGICLTSVKCSCDYQSDTLLCVTDDEIIENHKLSINILIWESAISAIVAILLHAIECLSACQMGIAVVVLSTLQVRMVNKKEV